MKAICTYTTSEEFECPFRGIEILLDGQRPEAVLDDVADAYFFMDLDAARRLKEVKFPEIGDENCENEIGKFMLHVCEQFKINEEE